jgi:methylthioribose-1-phosphate isomerase
MIKTIIWENEQLVILNQNKLPEEVIYEPCNSVHEVAEAIKTLKVRGAPLIGVTAAFGLALGVTQYEGSFENFHQYYTSIREELAATRPTAVNLFWALQRMDGVYHKNSHKSPAELGRQMLDEAQAMYEEDINTNKMIGEHGAQLLDKPSRVLTICNAGALATCGYGTALGVIRTAYKQNKIIQVWDCGHAQWLPPLGAHDKYAHVMEIRTKVYDFLLLWYRLHPTLPNPAVVKNRKAYHWE